jgi:hypothetical protein
MLGCPHRGLLGALFDCFLTKRALKRYNAPESLMSGEAVKNFILFVVILRNRASVLFFTAAKEALRDAELG